MSDGRPTPDDDVTVAERDLQAASYVLGLLCADERPVVERDAVADEALAAAIAFWERRLLPLTRLVAPLPVPSSLWQRIEASLGSAAGLAPASTPGPPPADPPARSIERQRSRGRQVAAVAGYLLAAAVAGMAILRPSPPPPRATALVPLASRTPIFVVQLLPRGALLVRPSGAVHVAAGRDLQLWLLAAGAARPVSLGVLPAAGIRLPPGSLPPDHPGAKILVSLEPRGGSPTGLPTGPVVGGGPV